MFNLYGTVARRPFAIGLLLRIALFVVATIAFPFLLVAYARSSHCGGDTCGIMGLIFTSAYKPLAFGLFYLSLPGLLMRRLRDIGLNPWWSTFLLLLIAADNQVLIFAGTSWSFGFTAGVLALDFPYFLLCALALLAVLTALPGRPGRATLRTLGWPAYLCVVLAGLIALLATLTLLQTIPGLLTSTLPLRRITTIGKLYCVTPLLMLALVPVSALTLWPRPGEIVLPADSADRPRLPLLILCLVALALTVIVEVVGLPRQFRDATFVMVQLGAVGAPTFALYFASVLTVYLLIWRRSWVALPLALVVAATFGSWVYAGMSDARSKTEDAQLVASTASTPLGGLRPRVALIEGSNDEFIHILLRRSDIDTVYLKLRKGFSQYSDGVSKPVRVDTIPATYLHLLTSAASAFASKGSRYTFQGPYEFRLTTPTTNQLVALQYEREIAPLLTLPILSTHGWMRDGNVMWDDVQNAKRAFIDQALGADPSPPPSKSAKAGKPPKPPKPPTPPKPPRPDPHPGRGRLVTETPLSDFNRA